MRFLRIGPPIVPPGLFEMNFGLALARSPKKYQVTGKVLEVTQDVIVVQKGDEKWEIGRDAATKVDGKLKVGDKVTIEYTMVAAKVEVKKDDKPAK